MFEGLQAPTALETILFAAFVFVPATVASVTWRNSADIRALTHEEERRGALAVWGALHAPVVLMTWSRLRWALEHVRSGTWDFGEIALVASVLVLSPWLLGKAAGLLARFPRGRVLLMSALGVLGPRSTTPWDRLTSRPSGMKLRLQFVSDGVTYTGEAVSFDTEGEQVLLDRIERWNGSEWEQANVTGAVVFQRGERALLFCQHNPADDAIQERFVDAWEPVPWRERWRATLLKLGPRGDTSVDQPAYSDAKPPVVPSAPADIADADAEPLPTTAPTPAAATELVPETVLNAEAKEPGSDTSA